MAAPSKKMSLLGLTTLVAINMMGSGIIMLPASMAQLGAISLLSWVVTALGSMAIATASLNAGYSVPAAVGCRRIPRRPTASRGFSCVRFCIFCR